MNKKLKVLVVALKAYRRTATFVTNGRVSSNLTPLLSSHNLTLLHITSHLTFTLSYHCYSLLLHYCFSYYTIDVFASDALYLLSKDIYEKGSRINESGKSRTSVSVDIAYPWVQTNENDKDKNPRESGIS